MWRGVQGRRESSFCDIIYAGSTHNKKFRYLHFKQATEPMYCLERGRFIRYEEWERL